MEKKGTKKYGLIEGNIFSYKPWEFICLDIYGPLFIFGGKIGNYSENKLVLTVIDVFTKWLEFVPLDDSSSETVSQAFFVNWLARYP